MLLVYYIVLEGLPGVLFGFSAVSESILICLGLILSLHTWTADSLTRGIIFLWLLVLSHIPILCKISFTIYYISHPTVRHYEAVAWDRGIELGAAIEARRESSSYPILLHPFHTDQEPTLLEAIYREQQPIPLETICSVQQEDGVEEVSLVNPINLPVRLF